MLATAKLYLQYQKAQNIVGTKHYPVFLTVYLCPDFSST